jgi:hypothetical protein
MENSLLILTIVQSVLILTLSSAVIYFGYQLYRNKLPQQTEIKPSKKRDLNQHEQAGNCHFHPQLKAETTCAICEVLICENCAKPQGKIHFCPEHNQTFKSNEWEILDAVKASADNTTASQYLYKFKKSLWSEKNIPTYIQVHYQINVDDDTIISEVQLFCIREHARLYRQLIQNQKEGSITQ